MAGGIANIVLLRPLAQSLLKIPSVDSCGMAIDTLERMTSPGPFLPVLLDKVGHGGDTPCMDGWSAAAGTTVEAEVEGFQRSPTRYAAQ